MSVLRQCSARASVFCAVQRAATGIASSSMSSLPSSSAARWVSSSASSREPATLEGASSTSATDVPPFNVGSEGLADAHSDSLTSAQAVTLATTIRQDDRLPHLMPMAEMADSLSKAEYLRDGKRQDELQRLLSEEGPKQGQGSWPIWIQEEYRAMRKEQMKAESAVDRAYRRARSLLWTPEGFEADKLDELIEDHAETLSESMRPLWQLQKDRQEQLDVVLRPYWDELTNAEQDQQLLRARYECLRRLGWRKGYTSGYPSDDGSPQRTQLLQDLRTGATTQVREATSKLAVEEEEDAWGTFQRLSSEERKAEEAMAWKLRDRSLLYIDDASSSHVVGARQQRWFSTPQRVGALTFLPNDIIRLVRNTTAPNAKYDAFKATFRVPLHMHKHGVRSYLLAVYGLRTTWCRSMIYRAPIKRDRLGQKRVGESTRTFKKVEVGLLEPFVFPEMTESFVRQHFMSQEIQAQMTSMYFKLSRRQRWRSQRMPDDIKHDKHGAALEENAPLDADRPDRLATMSGGIPTKRHSRILQMLNDKRRVHDALVAARVEHLKGQEK